MLQTRMAMRRTLKMQMSLTMMKRSKMMMSKNQTFCMMKERLSDLASFS